MKSSNSDISKIEIIYIFKIKFPDLVFLNSIFTDKVPHLHLLGISLFFFAIFSFFMQRCKWNERMSWKWKSWEWKNKEMLEIKRILMKEWWLHENCDIFSHSISSSFFLKKIISQQMRFFFLLHRLFDQNWWQNIIVFKAELSKPIYAYIVIHFQRDYPA